MASYITYDASVISAIDLILASNKKNVVSIVGEEGSGRSSLAHYLHSAKQKKGILGYSYGRFLRILDQDFQTQLDSEAFCSTFLKSGYESFYFEHIDHYSPTAKEKAVKLLEYMIGNRSLKQINIIISANKETHWHQELKKMSGKSGLLSRFEVPFFNIQLKPLRRRPEDIFLLLTQFLNRDPAEVFTPSAREDLLCYEWPHNIRELKLFAEGVLLKEKSNRNDQTLLDDKFVKKLLFTMSSVEWVIKLNQVFTSFDLDRSIRELGFKAFYKLIESILIHHSFLKYNQNLSKTAKSFGLPVTTLHSKIKGLKKQLAMASLLFPD